MNTFVGISQEPLSSYELRSLLEKLTIKPSYYFLRWAHKVSGILEYLPHEFPSPEGQMFNSEYEIRWKKRNDKYEILFLSKDKLNIEVNLISLQGDWEHEDREAHWYSTEKNPSPARFPKEFIFKNLNKESIPSVNIPVRQRYFRDKKTATVHFVALTIK